MCFPLTPYLQTAPIWRSRHSRPLGQPGHWPLGRLVPQPHAQRAFTFPVISFHLETADGTVVLSSGSSSMDEGWTALTHICCKASKQYSFCPLLLGYTSKSSSNGATETYFHVSGFGLKMKSESVTLKHSSPPVHRWLTIPELSLKHLSWSFVQIYFQCVLCVGSPCNAVNGLQGNGTGIFISKGKVTFSFPGPKGSGLRSKGALGVGMVGGYPTHYICFSALWGSAQAREEENYLLWRWRNCCSNGKINPAGFKAFPSSFQALHSTVCPWKLNSMGLNSTSWMTLGKSLNLSRPWWS